MRRKGSGKKRIKTGGSLDGAVNGEKRESKGKKGMEGREETVRSKRLLYSKQTSVGQCASVLSPRGPSKSMAL